MALEDNSTYKFIMKHKKFIQIVEGFLIIILIAGLWVMFFTTQDLKHEISENCGWGEEDYECYCKKTDVDILKSDIYNQEININLSNVPR